jgi:hypothetical protein
VHLNGAGPAPAGNQPNGYAPTNGHAGGHLNGYANGHSAQAPRQPTLGPAPPDFARHHHAPHAEQRQGVPQPTPAERLFLPAPEKNYIIGRVVSGLLLLIGALGIFAGIVFLYAAISDPGVYGVIGMAQPAQALLFSGSVFIASVVMLIASQIATAIFDGADAVADVARLERYRAGDYGDEDDE